MSSTAHGTAGAAARRVVVGLDGSPASAEALLVAARVAGRLGARLAVVSTVHYPPTFGRYPLDMTDLRPITVQWQQELVQDRFGGSVPADFELIVRDGAPAPALVDETRTADLLVVGTRGHGGFAGLLLGSVSMGCIAAAHCPVLVVHPPEEHADSVHSGRRQRVVVGVSGGPTSGAALRAASRAAHELQADLEAVTAWSDSIWAGELVQTAPELLEEAGADVKRAVGTALGDGARDVTLTSLLGSPASALVEASRDAALLVIGRARRSEILGAVTGALGFVCAAHAHCPVLVVPDPVGRPTGV